MLVGGGAREHALAWKLTHDDPSLELLAAPGNPGIAELGRCIPVNATNVAALVDLAGDERPDLTIIGPEAPLAAGLADALREHRVSVFGPSAAAARIESSKAFAKQVMLDAGVPTARAERHVRPDDAKRAARSLGAPAPRIILQHLLPNAAGPIIVRLTFGIPQAIFTEAVLSFIGLGVRPPQASWGTMIQQGNEAIFSAPHLVLFPGIAIALTMLAFNFLGDGLRDALDPQNMR